MRAPEEETPAPGGALGSESQTGKAGDTEHSAPRVDLDQARRCLQILDPEAESWDFRTFGDGQRGAGRLYSGSLEDCAAPLQIDNGKGRGVFFAPNEGGPDDASVTRIRAVWADFDGVPLPTAFRLEPHLVIETSARRYHVYWLVDDLPTAAFKQVQQAISVTFGSDTSVCNPSRVMRLPGFIHQKPADADGHDGKPFRSAIIHESGALPYAAAQVMAAFPPRASAIQSPTSQAIASGNHVVQQDRHADLLRLAGREARSVVFDGVSRDAALAKLRAEVGRGRYSRDVPDDEVQRALDGAIAKCRSGEWRPPSAASTWTPQKSPRGPAFCRASELIANPRPLAWLIRGVLELDSFALMFADPGVGKTFLALDIAFSVACGTDWHGRRVYAGPVFYIAGEGGNGLGRRLRALELARGREIGAAPLFVSTVPASLTDAEGAGDALAAVDAMVQHHGKPSLIVLDTVARNFGGGDENSTRDMTAFVAACDRIRESTGACVLLVHHSGHGDKSRARGSTALKGALDWEYSLSKDAGTLQLECTKAKDAEPPPPMSFRLTPVDLGIADEDGEPITSAALSPALYMRPSSTGKAGRGKNQTAALRVLRELLQVERARLDQIGGDTDNATVPLASWREGCAAEGIKANRFAELAKTLQAAGLATVQHDRVSDHDTRDFAPE